MRNTAKETILVVDDIPENIDLLCGILSNDYNMRVASNGQVALKIALEQSPDLILLDVSMPDMDGYEVCIILKTNDTTRHIPVIFVTALSDVQDESHGFELGASDYIIKPVSAPIVLARVRAHLDLADQRRNLERLVAERTMDLENSNQQLESSNQKLRQSYLSMLLQLGRAAECRDSETGKHVLRVGNYSKLLGLASGFTESQAEMLMYASMMHDIGKIGIRDDILLKQGELTEEEFEIMKRHSEIGAEIIGDHDADMLEMAKYISLTHHEKWNGTGYPLGLRGEDIPIVGRIVAIADVFDALTTARPYKQAWPIERALEYLRYESGQHFDPELIRLFIGMEAEILQIAFTYSDAKKP